MCIHVHYWYKTYYTCITHSLITVCKMCVFLHSQHRVGLSLVDLQSVSSLSFWLSIDYYSIILALSVPSRIVCIVCSDECCCGCGVHTDQSQNQVGLLQCMVQRDSEGNVHHRQGLVVAVHCNRVVNRVHVYQHVKHTHYSSKSMCIVSVFLHLQ